MPRAPSSLPSPLSWRTLPGVILANLLSPLKISTEQLLKLLAPIGHSSNIRRHAAAVIISRVRLVAAVFAFAVPLWSGLDLLVLPAPEWAQMTALRCASAVVFAFLAWPWPGEGTRLRADGMLFVLLIVPPAFYLASLGILEHATATDAGRLVEKFYAQLPNVVLAGLAIFPLTALEAMVFALPTFVFMLLGIRVGGGAFSLLEYGPALWLMILILGASMFSGMSQLHYMAALVERATIDPLTGAYTRRIGGEVLSRLFEVSARQRTPLTVMFLDIDRFKAVNDQYGHEAGDHALAVLVKRLRGALRSSDVLVRWGGDEFIIILNGTDLAGAHTVLERLKASGPMIGLTGERITTSFGVVERMADEIADWTDLIKLADTRMYEAKQGGGARAVLPQGRTIDFISPVTGSATGGAAGVSAAG